ncbi:urease accessory UreF family protein [Streptomyces sp. B-S-A8]|uniref:Urease accessory UreF family protein n=1 Tax=Streptomyces solicavernae TaxID=3043614 RepID=A0ABT6RX69_9ACTN|nr:urease accessory UreF family protein [Streptomyces sp. B-S-A8]MDI3389008.1 urease accessory UreF family protein [Streptomyces sp. B-S-A8]
MPGLAPLLLGDGRLPVGAYTYSAGLEPAVAAGLTRDRIPALLRARLRTAAVTEAAAAVLALRAAGQDLVDYGPVQRALAARTPAAPLREASAALGRGVHRLARRLAPDRPAVTALSAVRPRPLRPVTLGALGAVLNVSEEDLAHAVVYDELQTITSAALKLLPGDPLDTVAWVLAAEPDATAAAHEALAVRTPAELPARTAPLTEEWALQHARRERRLFLA